MSQVLNLHVECSVLQLQVNKQAILVYRLCSQINVDLGNEVVLGCSVKAASEEYECCRHT